MIPCYKESLAIIQRTVYACRRADRPFGMRLIIYLCDDGSDPKKRDWIASLSDPNIIYVTGALPVIAQQIPGHYLHPATFVSCCPNKLL